MEFHFGAWASNLLLAIAVVVLMAVMTPIAMNWYGGDMWELMLDEKFLYDRAQESDDEGHSEEESTGCGAKVGSTGVKDVLTDEVAEGSTTPAQDPVNAIKSQNECSPSRPRHEGADEILQRTSVEIGRNVVVDGMISKLLKDGHEEAAELSTERGATSEVRHGVAEGSTSVEDLTDTNLQTESASNRGEELPRDQADGLNFLERTSMEETWRNVLKEVLPGEVVVPLEAVPREVMAQVLKVVEKLQGSLARMKTIRDHSIWAPTWRELDARPSWMKLKTTPFQSVLVLGDEGACSC